MESKGDDVFSNASDAPEKDQTLIPTLNQDQEGDGEEKKTEPEADADSDGTIDLLLDEIRALNIEKRVLELHLGDARKELHRNRENLAAAAVASNDFEAEANRLKRAIKDLQAEKANLADANAVLEAEISALEVRLLAAAEGGKDLDLLALRTRADLLKMKVRGLSEDLWHSMDQAEAAVKDQVEIREAREDVLKQAVKALKETKTRLERELAGILSQIDMHVGIQGEHDTAVAPMARGLKLSWVLAAVASVGALAAVAVNVCFRNIRQR